MSIPADERGSQTPGVSEVLATFCATTTFADLPPAVVADAKRAVLDWFGSALAGSLEPAAVMARRVAAGFGASEQATVFPGGRASAAGAALVNGVAAHILELDDIHKGSTVHGAAPVVSAALATAERGHADGRAFLLAVTLGYEAALRVGEAVNPSHYRFWHPTGTAATFGAAAAAGSLLRLDPGQMRDAFGSAGTQAAGLWEFNADGAMSKHLHPGKAAFNGLLAADLAGAGFTGAARILEGERGFFAAMSEGADPGRITNGLGERWQVSENGYKLHSCCGHTHTAIDLALAFRTEFGWGDGETAAGIGRVRIDTYGPGHAIVSERNPATPYQGKFSLAYVVAVALLEGRVDLEQFGAERFGPDGVRDAAVRALLDRIEIQVDPELSARYPSRWPARVTLDLTDGRRLTAEADYPRGNPELAVSLETLEAKVRGLIAPRFDGAFADAVIGLVRELEHVPDLAATMRALMTGR